MQEIAEKNEVRAIKNEQNKRVEIARRRGAEAKMSGEISLTGAGLAHRFDGCSSFRAPPSRRPTANWLGHA